jgi:exodeoxyribonuclease III
MKIITWNCNMAFRRKAEVILKYKPDILIVPECEHPDKLQFSNPKLKPQDSLWFGNNLNKGLGIFSYNSFRFKLKKNYDPRFQTIIPVSVTGGQFDFTLYAIWAWNPTDPDGRYVEQIWKALHHYERHLTKQHVILAGDFNSNTIWDKKYRIGNHSHVVKKLEAKKIYSTYHLHYKQEHGNEKHPTLYMYRHKDKPYHIDYCFASGGLAERLQSVRIGKHKFWTRYSDHVPVMVTIE